MDRSDVVTLISKITTRDSRGVPHSIENKIEVFCSVKSVNSAEFFEGSNAGLKPQYKIVLFAYDYSGETTVEYQGNRYSVYRSYQGKNDNLELYVEKDAGS